MADQFTIGDVVQLKSGGPLMTVQEVGVAAEGRPLVKVVWFDKSDWKTGSFPPDTLEVYDEEA